MITYGFYNSVDHDRRYDAIQFGSIFDGVIKDGVFMSVGTCLRVIPMEDMSVLVGEGRAWFNHTWTLNDSPLIIELSDSEIVTDRIDAIVLDVNANPESRKNDIIVIKGIPSKTPQRPELINNENRHQYPLAYISVRAGVTSIRAADITSMIGTSETPYVTGILETVNIDALLDQWKDQYQEFYENQTEEMQETYNLWKAETEAWSNAYKDNMEDFQQTQEAEMEAWVNTYKAEMESWTNTYKGNMEEWSNEQKTEFNEWFNSLQVMLEPDEATNLANAIVTLKGNFKKLEKHAILDSGYTPINDDDPSNPDNPDEPSDPSNTDIFAILDEVATVEMRRGIWRGKNLGTEVTEEQYENIANGTFKGLFLGDYWEISSNEWVIADFDYWIMDGTSSINSKTHHLAMIPRITLNDFVTPPETVMNNTADTSLGYFGSTMRKNTINTLTNILEHIFGDIHILTRKSKFVNSASNGVPLSLQEVYDKVEIPNENMIFGSYIYSPYGIEQNNPAKRNYINRQLSAMRLSNNLIRGKDSSGNYTDYWLRTIATDKDYVYVDIDGNPNIKNANQYLIGIRPVFALCKEPQA